MDAKKFLTRIVLFIFSILLLNYLAMKFYWYSSIWYFDMPMHFLGGVWLGLALLWFLKIKEISLMLIFKMILGVLIIGVLWEIFEIILNNYTTQSPFNSLDTISDIFFDVITMFFSF